VFGVCIKPNKTSHPDKDTVLNTYIRQCIQGWASGPVFGQTANEKENNKYNDKFIFPSRFIHNVRRRSSLPMILHCCTTSKQFQRKKKEKKRGRTNCTGLINSLPKQGLSKKKNIHNNSHAFQSSSNVVTGVQ
jgi:hypothetical protein